VEISLSPLSTDEGTLVLSAIRDTTERQRAATQLARPEFHPEPIDLPHLVGEVRDILRAVSAAKHIAIDVAIDPSCSGLELDPSKLKQVLFKYLSNALKFTPDHGRVVIRARPEGPDAFRLEVEDSGIGSEQTT